MPKVTRSKDSGAERDNSIGLRVKVLSQLLGRRLQAKLDPFDLTPVHWLVLKSLWYEDGQPLIELGEKVQQVGGTMTGVIDRMEGRELLNRRRDTYDRRIYRVWLTEKGKEMRHVLPPIIAKNRQKLIRGIPSADYECFQRVLDKLIANATADLNELE